MQQLYNSVMTKEIGIAFLVIFIFALIIIGFYIAGSRYYRQVDYIYELSSFGDDLLYVGFGIILILIFIAIIAALLSFGFWKINHH